MLETGEISLLWKVQLEALCVKEKNKHQSNIQTPPRNQTWQYSNETNSLDHFDSSQLHVCLCL